MKQIGETTLALIEQGSEHIMTTYAQSPIVLESGAGCTVKDTDGNTYLDFVAGIAVNALGYGDPILKERLTKVIEGGLTHCSNLYWNSYAIEAAAGLARLSGLDRVFFCNSGAEANEAALKLARKYGSTRRHPSCTKIVSMHQSFHGRTYGAITATGQHKYHKGFAPLMPNIVYGDFNDLEQVSGLVDEDTCAIIVEPIQGEGGIKPATKEFLQGLRDLCDQTGTLLIYDEVQCGMGRTGEPFAFHYYGVRPDAVSLAKGLGAGVPIGALVATEELASTFSPGDHATTFGGNLLAAAAATVMIERLSDPVMLQSIKNAGLTLRTGLLELQRLFPDLIKEVRGVGLMLGMEMTTPVAAIISACKEQGLLLVNAGTHIIRFVPPLIVKDEEIAKAIAIVKEVIGSSR